MPVKNGRLICCTCGADLGDAEDPYRDPDCAECDRRSNEQELLEAKEPTARDRAEQETAQARAQLLFDLFVTAMEGGIGYWSRCRFYRWSTGDHETEDLQGFEALIEVGEEQTERVIDRAVIEKGLTLLAEGKCTFAGQPWTERVAEYAGMLAGATAGAEVDCDAENADQIVQAGLFGDVMYG